MPCQGQTMSKPNEAEEVPDSVPLTKAVERILQQFLEETEENEAPMEKREIEDTILRRHRQHVR